MGVTQLWQILDPVKKHKPLVSLAGSTLAVDLSIWVCETQSVKQMQGVVSKPFLRNLFFRISHLTQLGVKLVFVVDGKAPEIKWEAMWKRQQARFPGKQGNYMGKPGGRRNFKSCLKECCELLEILGIPYIQSQGEAEALCAVLNACGLCDGCLTNDGDAFLYGARVVYRNFTMNSKDPHVESYDMSDIENQLGIDRSGLIGLGLLLGCDYLPKGVPGIGVANAVKLLDSLQGYNVLKRLNHWRTMSEHDCRNQIEQQTRRKALALPDFPQQKVVKEFLDIKDKCPSKVANWRRPKISKFQDFAFVKLEWPQDYGLEKVLPLVTLWDMRDIIHCAGNSQYSCQEHLKPNRIVKSRIRQGIPCFEIEWFKEDSDADPGYYTTVETQELFGQCFPEITSEFQADLENKKTKGKGKTKKARKNMLEEHFEPEAEEEIVKLASDLKDLGIDHCPFTVTVTELDVCSQTSASPDTDGCLHKNACSSVASDLVDKKDVEVIWLNSSDDEEDEYVPLSQRLASKRPTSLLDCERVPSWNPFEDYDCHGNQGEGNNCLQEDAKDDTDCQDTSSSEEDDDYVPLSQRVERRLKQSRAAVCSDKEHQKRGKNKNNKSQTFDQTALNIKPLSTSGNAHTKFIVSDQPEKEDKEKREKNKKSCSGNFDQTGINIKPLPLSRKEHTEFTDSDQHGKENDTDQSMTSNCAVSFDSTNPSMDLSAHFSPIRYYPPPVIPMESVVSLSNNSTLDLSNNHRPGSSENFSPKFCLSPDNVPSTGHLTSERPFVSPVNNSSISVLPDTQDFACSSKNSTPVNPVKLSSVQENLSLELAFSDNYSVTLCNKDQNVIPAADISLANGNPVLLHLTNVNVAGTDGVISLNDTPGSRSEVSFGDMVIQTSVLDFDNTVASLYRSPAWVVPSDQCVPGGNKDPKSVSPESSLATCNISPRSVNPVECGICPKTSLATNNKNPTSVNPITLAISPETSVNAMHTNKTSVLSDHRYINLDSNNSSSIFPAISTVVTNNMIPRTSVVTSNNNKESTTELLVCPDVVSNDKNSTQEVPVCLNVRSSSKNTTSKVPKVGKKVKGKRKKAVFSVDDSVFEMSMMPTSTDIKSRIRVSGVRNPRDGTKSDTFSQNSNVQNESEGSSCLDLDLVDLRLESFVRKIENVGNILDGFDLSDDDVFPERKLPKSKLDSGDSTCANISVKNSDLSSEQSNSFENTSSSPTVMTSSACGNESNTTEMVSFGNMLIQTSVLNFDATCVKL